MGLAMAAELNSYPRPAHVLELASALNLVINKIWTFRLDFNASG
jgi:hypothetical protein